MKKCIQYILKIFRKEKRSSEHPELFSSYSDFDYLKLAEIYAKNEWIRHKANFVGFENLWNDYNKMEEKNILERLISNFNYLTYEDAEIHCKTVLEQIINEWGLTQENCLFVGTKLGSTPDGSEIFLGFIKGVLRSIDDRWAPHDLSTSIEESKVLLEGKEKRTKKKHLKITKIVLVDDFVGTGKTANSRIECYEQDLKEMKLDVDVYFFSLAGMKLGFHLLKTNNRRYHTCIQLDKGVDLSYEYSERQDVRNKIKQMESILSPNISKKQLSEYSLGWGGSEALYSWTRNNTPNNVFPIFWWSRYKKDIKRKTMFNRMQ